MKKITFTYLLVILFVFFTSQLHAQDCPTNAVDNGNMGFSYSFTVTDCADHQVGVATMTTDGGGMYISNTCVADGSGTFVVTYQTTNGMPDLLSDGGIVATFSGVPGTCPYADDGTFLPVELLFFAGKYEDEKIRLQWATASETDNEKFEIEVSQDAKSFKKIGEVRGQGTTLERQDYQFLIHQATPGVHYYRLKQIDWDGQYEYSEVVSVRWESKDVVGGMLYPNPSQTGQVSLSYVSTTTSSIQVQVVDVMGKIVFQRTISVVEGDNTFAFDWAHLPTGNYVIKVHQHTAATHYRLVLN